MSTTIDTNEHAKLHQIGARLAKYLGEKPKVTASEIVVQALEKKSIANALVKWDEGPEDKKDELFDKLKSKLPKKKGPFGR